MKRIVSVLIAFVMIITLAGCDSSEDHVGEAKTPSGSEALKGQTYQDVVKKFEEHGFTNIKTEKLEDLITGWMTKEGEVEKVSVGGDESYSPDRWIANDIEVVIAYHAFPEEKESETEKSESSGTSSKESQEQDIYEDPLTIDNNQELASILLVKDNLDLTIKSFAEKYDGQIIKFDAYIADIAKHKDYETRFDILIYAGDYSETESVGPSFKFEDVNIVSDLNLTGSNIPDNLIVGQHVRVTVRVEEYRESSGLFIIKPLTTEIR